MSDSPLNASHIFSKRQSNTHCFLLITVWIVFFVIGSEKWEQFFLEKQLKRELIWPQNTVSLAAMGGKWIEHYSFPAVKKEHFFVLITKGSTRPYTTPNPPPTTFLDVGFVIHNKVSMSELIVYLSSLQVPSLLLSCGKITSQRKWTNLDVRVLMLTSVMCLSQTPVIHSRILEWIKF